MIPRIYGGLLGDQPRGMNHAITLLLVFSATSLTHAATFQGIGDLSGGANESYANAISADSRAVVGSSVGPSGQQATVWTAGSGILGLGFLPGGSGYSEAFAVSTDGSNIVGTSRSTLAAAPNSQAFLFNSGGFSPLQGFGPSNNSVAYAINGPATLAFGFAETSAEIQAAWSDVTAAPVLAAAGQIRASSESGTAIAGLQIDAGVTQAFTINGSSGVILLGDFPGGNTLSAAFGISGNGQVVVGFGSTAAGFEAFRWTQASGLVSLGDFPVGLTASSAFGASRDGSIIIGSGETSSGAAAFLWTTARGLENLNNVLFENTDADLTGWTLERATGITPDGTGIVGNGTHNGVPEGWVVTGFSFDTTKPRLEFAFSKRIVTSVARLRLRGTVFDEGRVISVKAKVGKKGFRASRQIDPWAFTARLKPGKNKVLLRATDAAGNVSKTVRIVITRTSA